MSKAHSIFLTTLVRMFGEAYSLKLILIVIIPVLVVLGFWGLAIELEQPVAIFHAFDQSFPEIETLVCDLADQGYSHIQIPPTQKSNPSPEWWSRYQPVDYRVIEGRGSEADLKRLIDQAHRCHIKVIADVVLNHMADMPQYQQRLDFPGLSAADFHPRCAINYSDGNTDTERNCWLGTLPDLNQTRHTVQQLHHAHLKKLLDLGIDGFRFDAAKHMPPSIVKTYIDYVKAETQGKAWNYLEVIEDNDTKSEDYNWIAPITDFRLYNSLKTVFSNGGDLRSLGHLQSIQDDRSVVFGRNHDTIKELNPYAINPYDNNSDSFLATAYLLAREGGTPLILNWDHQAIPYIPSGVKFRQLMRQYQRWGRNVNGQILAAIDSPTLFIMERGNAGFVVVNTAAEPVDRPTLSLTLSHLQGCYRELRYQFTVTISGSRNGQTWITRWGRENRGGIQIKPRDALYFVRESWINCQ